ncbi:hypothetical protein KAR10_10165, partial [bacterium]|nr:hypothetical protein [bacterium]
MKKILFFLFCFALATTSLAQREGTGGISTWININKIKKFYDWQGITFFGPPQYDHSILLSGYGFAMRGPGLIYRDGLVWGGLVRDGGLPAKRTCGSTFVIGEIPGWIENGEPFDWESQSAGGGELRVYRYKKGWESISDSALTADAADIFNIDPEEVTDGEKKAVYEQYQLDFEDWPVHRGAPFVDKDENGTYEPENGDYPGLLEADQVIWMIFNDLSTRTIDFGGSPPIGLEHRITAWAYENRDGFRETIFERHQLKSHAGGTIDSMYIASWVDSDLGNYTDDYVGCDSVINLVYAYN